MYQKSQSHNRLERLGPQPNSLMYRQNSKGLYSNNADEYGGYRGSFSYNGGNQIGVKNSGPNPTSMIYQGRNTERYSSYNNENLYNNNNNPTSEYFSGQNKEALTQKYKNNQLINNQNQFLNHPNYNRPSFTELNPDRDSTPPNLRNHSQMINSQVETTSAMKNELGYDSSFLRSSDAFWRGMDELERKRQAQKNRMTSSGNIFSFNYIYIISFLLCRIEKVRSCFRSELI